MDYKSLLATAAVLLAFCGSCVDPGYGLGNIETEGTLFRNMEVPIGSFEIITLQTMLKAPGSTLLPQPPLPGPYQLDGSAEITGISFEFDDGIYFLEAELHTVIHNTMPLDMRCSVTAIDAEGQPCQDVSVTVSADKTPMIASGRPGSPTENPIVLHFKGKGKNLTMDGLRLTFHGQSGSGFEGEAPAMDQGITLKKVYLKLPEGIKFTI